MVTRGSLPFPPGVLTRSVRDTAAFCRESELLWRKQMFAATTGQERRLIELAFQLEGAGPFARPERLVLAVLGIALAIACVTVVRTISASFASTGEELVTDVLGQSQLWVFAFAMIDPWPAGYYGAGDHYTTRC